ncbi:hypothetical protein KC460_00120 [Candidatus Dependentiae bacterium]|nr:hypothetical protein [Candidatus Dependentiae bacterium]
MNRKVEPPSYFDEGLKVAGGLGSILAGASVVRKSFEHMQTIPVTWTVEGIKHSAKIFKDQFFELDNKTRLMIYGGAACIGIGLSLMVWGSVKSGRLLKSKKENLFNTTNQTDGEKRSITTTTTLQLFAQKDCVNESSKKINYNVENDTRSMIYDGAALYTGIKFGFLVSLISVKSERLLKSKKENLFNATNQTDGEKRSITTTTTLQLVTQKDRVNESSKKINYNVENANNEAEIGSIIQQKYNISSIFTRRKKNKYMFDMLVPFIGRVNKKQKRRYTREFKNIRKKYKILSYSSVLVFPDNIQIIYDQDTKWIPLQPRFGKKPIELGVPKYYDPDYIGVPKYYDSKYNVAIYNSWHKVEDIIINMAIRGFQNFSEDDCYKYSLQLLADYNMKKCLTKEGEKDNDFAKLREKILREEIYFRTFPAPGNNKFYIEEDVDIQRAPGAFYFNGGVHFNGGVYFDGKDVKANQLKAFELFKYELFKNIKNEIKLKKRKPCVFINYKNENNEIQEYMVIKMSNNEYKIKAYNSRFMIIESGGSYVFTIRDGENIQDRTLQAIKILQENLKSKKACSYC